MSIYSSRPWLQAIDPLVPREIELPEIPVYKFLSDSFEKFPNNIAIYYYGTEFTYAEMEHLTNKLANGLKNIGIKKGDRVAIHMDNCPQYAFGFFALMKLGAVVVQASPMASAKELLAMVNDSGAKGIITLDYLLGKVREIFDESPLEFIVVGSLHDYLPINPFPCAPFAVPDPLPIPQQENIFEFNKLLNQSCQFDCADINPREDLAVLQYTSGTTGIPKGVMINHYNITSYVTCARMLDYKNIEGQEVYPVNLPLSHNYAMFQTLVLPVSLGGKVVIMVRFHPDEALKTIHYQRCTCFRAVPTILAILAQHPKLEEFDLTSVRHWIVGGAPVPEKIVNVFKKVSGGNVAEGYGLTETTSGAIINRLYGQTLAGMGMPFIGTDIRVIDPGTDEDIPIGETGELLIKGPTVSAGYWEKSEETAKTFEDGWLHTGDLVRLTAEGVLQFVDRLKELIIVAGFNVYPSEVENTIYQHPAIMEAAVIGKPDERQGEIVKAIVRLKPGFELKEEELIAFCQERISPYKVPKIVQFVEDFPRTAVGKILKRALK
jgi:long-chain acyl-CoA synthetase